MASICFKNKFFIIYFSMLLKKITSITKMYQ